MNALFVDTSGWGNLFGRNQPYDLPAAEFYRAARLQHRSIVTTSYIIAELIALLHSSLREPRKQAIALIENIKTSSYVQIIHVDYELDARLATFEKTP